MTEGLVRQGRWQRAARVARVWYFVVCAIVLPLGLANGVVMAVELSTAVERPMGEKTAQFKQGNKVLFNTPRLMAWSRTLKRFGIVGTGTLLASGAVMMLVRRAAGQRAP